jgi:RNA polymerase sigma-54 factor
LQQAIKLLQLSNLELQAFLEREIEQNPLIEWDERTGDDFSGNGKSDANADGSENGASTPSQSETPESFDVNQDFSDDVEIPPPAVYETLSLRSQAGRPADGDTSFEAYTAQEITLRDHLRGQLHMAVTCPSRRLIGDHLIDLIDEAGYLRGSCEEVADRLGAPFAWAEEVLSTIQSLDPAGVGARSLAECLALQLKERNRYDPAIAALLDNLDLLAARDFTKLRRICEVDEQDIYDMAAEIRALNPKPGLQYGSQTVNAVVPDILLSQDANGAWRVQLNSETLPRILVNHGFYTAAKTQARTTADRTYLQNCMSTANWLARSLDQRRQTMLKVAREIVKQQEGFFVHGVRSMKPLSLRDIAEQVGMHESTISRVTSSKYMQTPRGTFELKYFFTPAIQATNSGDAYSSEAVKDRIRELIANESPRRILSDDTIVSLLNSEGIDIARRTVAKYRESLRIPSSVQRRRDKSTPCVKAAE